MIKIIFFKMYIFMLLTILAVPSASAGTLNLTKEEIKLVGDFSNTIPVEKGVGQFFMINLDINYIDSFNRRRWGNNIKNDKPIHRRLINEEGFGSVILKKNNFQYLKQLSETEEERMRLIKTFVSNMQYRAISKSNSSLGVPLFIAADFEGPYLNSLADTLTPPLSSLTLAITQDKALIEKAGTIAGYQLASSGINMVLGPVLDIENNPQGTINTQIENRSYSSDPESATKIAKHYITGLHRAGLNVVGKHFPGLGMVDGNPHFKIIKFSGDNQDLKKHLTPYYKLQPLLNGIMTSHVSIPLLDNREGIPATFSKPIIEFIRENSSTDIQVDQMNYKDKLIISDDMGMGAITNYKNEKNKNYSDLTIKAFEAGHDIIMFGKIVTDKKYKREKSITRGIISISQLIEVKNNLEKHLKRPENSDKYKDKLKRIILAKAASYKLLGGDIKTFIKGEINKIPESNLIVPDFIKTADGSINLKSIERIYTEIIEKSYLLLSGNISDLLRGQNMNACIFSKEDLHENYQGLSQEYKKLHMSNSIHQMVVNQKKNKIFKNKNTLSEATTKIISFIKKSKCDVNLYVADSFDSLKFISNVVINQSKEEAKTKHAIFLHITPTALSEELLKTDGVIVAGAFTKHPLSYVADVKVIKGDIQTNSKDLLTITFQGKLNEINIPDLKINTKLTGDSLTSVINHKKDHTLRKNDFAFKQLKRRHRDTTVQLSNLEKEHTSLNGRNENHLLHIETLEQELLKVSLNLSKQQEENTTLNRQNSGLRNKKSISNASSKILNPKPQNKPSTLIGNPPNNHQLLNIIFWLLAIISSTSLFLNLTSDTKDKLTQSQGFFQCGMIILNNSIHSPKLIANFLSSIGAILIALYWQKLL